jgi:hypothetical protein
LTSIICNRETLLDSLLKAMHSSQSTVKCRICEAGSRFRRIVAIALSTYRASYVDLLVNHIRSYRGDWVVDLGKIEVWFNQALIPLWQIPFRSILVTAIDLPESFFRAMTYGKRYKDALRESMDFCKRTRAGSDRHLYMMIKESVIANNYDALDHLLSHTKEPDEEFSCHLLGLQRADVPSSPVMLSIRYGSRDMFRRLWESNTNLFKSPFKLLCEDNNCKYCTFKMVPSCLRRRCTVKPENHKFNLTHTALSLAVTAAHQDRYFL